MFKRVSNFDWKEHEDVRLRVARLRATVKADPDRAGPVSLSRVLWRRPRPNARHFPAITRWLRRLLAGDRRRH